jgi:hypothetical protein
MIQAETRRQVAPEQKMLHWVRDWFPLAQEKLEPGRLGELLPKRVSSLRPVVVAAEGPLASVQIS